MRCAYMLISIATLAISTARSDERPNILIVLTDDMGFSDLGCFGGEIETPNLDALAAGGLRFSEFHNTARCWPTRATLLSGRYSNRLGKHQITIAQALQTAGYQTGMVGKWHLGRDPNKDGPLQRGFDSFYGTMIGAGSFWNPMSLTRNTKPVDPQGEDFYYTDRIGAEAVRQIENFARSDAPFFQYVAFTAAHWPLHAPEHTIQKYLPRYQSGWDQLRADRYARMIQMGIIDERRWPLPEREPGVQSWARVDHKPWHVRNMAIYAAMVDHMDQAVGRIVGSLKRTGRFENTWIVYFHDNGACAEHLSGNGWNTANNILAWARENQTTVAVGDRYDVPMGGPLTYGSVGHNWAHSQNTPLRRYKANVHEGGACTPAIMHWPRGLKHAPGSITLERGHVVDMMATCLELAGGRFPATWDGVSITDHESLSLVPVIAGRRQPRDHAYYFNHGGTHAVIQGDFKIIRERNGAWALYNLSKNRTETQNLAAQDPQRVQRMAALWRARWEQPSQ